jgi:hypothetical protein
MFLRLFASTFRVVLPFVLIADAGVARRAFSALGIAMLFARGHAWGRCAGPNPWRTGGSVLKTRNT